MIVFQWRKWKPVEDIIYFAGCKKREVLQLGGIRYIQTYSDAIIKLQIVHLEIYVTLYRIVLQNAIFKMLLTFFADVLPHLETKRKFITSRFSTEIVTAFHLHQQIPIWKWTANTWLNKTLCYLSIQLIGYKQLNGKSIPKSRICGVNFNCAWVTTL